MEPIKAPLIGCGSIRNTHGRLIASPLPLHSGGGTVRMTIVKFLFLQGLTLAIPGTLILIAIAMYLLGRKRTNARTHCTPPTGAAASV